MFIITHGCNEFETRNYAFKYLEVPVLVHMLIILVSECKVLECPPVFFESGYFKIYCMGIGCVLVMCECDVTYNCIAKRKTKLFVE